MATVAAYDSIADWYEEQFLAGQADGDPLGIDRVAAGAAGPGQRGYVWRSGAAPAYTPARFVRWAGPRRRGPVRGHVAHATGRLPIVRGDARQLPVRDAALDAVVSVMVHTDMPDYPAVIGEVARVLRPGGVFVHVGVHPCFCGGFADRADPDAVVIRPGYVDGHWTRASWTDQGVRDKVGATHRPLPDLLHAFLGRRAGPGTVRRGRRTDTHHVVPAGPQAVVTGMPVRSAYPAS